MPNNDYNNLFNNTNPNNDLPKEQNDFLDMPMPAQNTPTMPNVTPKVEEIKEERPMIEIPQKYYDNLAKEQAEKEAAEHAYQQKHQESVAASNEFSIIVFLSTICAMLTFGALYAAINIKELIIFAIPAYIVLGSIIAAIKTKKENSFPVTILVGGMIVAVITFVLSMLQEDKMDMWTYYAIAGAVVGFLGLITANIITNIIVKRKEIKALQTVGYLLYFALLVAVPYYLYTNYRTEFYKFVFQKQTVVQAETEEEFTLKTLKTRYGIEFTCELTKQPYKYTVDKRKVVERVCKDSNSNQFIVNSITYNEGKNQHVVIDNYFEVALLQRIKNEIIADLNQVSKAIEYKVYLYPENDCTFTGDCVDCDEYFEKYKDLNDINKQFKTSTELNLSKEIYSNPKDFLNKHKYKIVIEVVDKYGVGNDNYSLVVDTLINQLNQKGYKNTYGYIITLNQEYEEVAEGFAKKVYQVKGDTNAELKFKDPVVVDINSN